MKNFAGKEIVTFLKAVDKHLKRRARIEMIGGAVALVCFKGTRGTWDIDITGSPNKILEACKAARALTGLEVPIQTAVWEAPYEYETRLTRLKHPKLTKLQIYVPEKHDWVLMKLARYNEKDAQDIKGVASSIGLNKNTLVERFTNEMTHITTNPRELVMSFVLMVESLYGKSEADKLDNQLSKDKRWSIHRS